MTSASIFASAVTPLLSRASWNVPNVPLIAATAVLVALCLSGPANAQTYEEAPEWKEADVPSPPPFDVAKLVTFDVSAGSSLVFGFDPATVTISRRDGVVRYVLVATSASGVKNILYEGLRCDTGEFKTYARYGTDGQWKPVADPQWRSMFGAMPSKHPLRLANAGGCDNRAPPSSVTSMVSRIKTATPSASN